MSRKTKTQAEDLTPTLTKLIRAAREYSFVVDDSLPHPLTAATPIILGYDVVCAGEKLMSPEAVAKLERVERSNPSTRSSYRTTDSEYNKIMTRVDSAAHLIRLPFPQCWFEFTPDYKIPFFRTTAWEFGPALEYATGIFASEEPTPCGGRRITAWVSGVSSGVVSGRRITLPYEPYVALELELAPKNEMEATIVSSSFRVYQEPENRSIGSCWGDFSTRAGLEMYLLNGLAINVLPIVNSPAICIGANVATRSPGFNAQKPRTSTAIKFSTTREYQSQIKADNELEADAVRRGVHAHFVRGHFKHKKNGLFWWNAHIRGVGAPEAKPYEVSL